MRKKDTLIKLKKDLLLLGYGITALNFLSIDVNAMSNKETSINAIQTVRNYDDDFDNTSDIISYYSRVFGIREEYIYDMFEYQTNDYNNIEYNNIEAQIINIVREIYYNYNDYGYQPDNFKTNTEYCPTKSPEELIEKYSDIFNINKNIALAICYNECGIDINSKNFRNNNNPAGIGPHKYFENYEIGIIYYILMLKNDYNCTIDSDTDFLSTIARTYCPDTPEMWYRYK